LCHAIDELFLPHRVLLSITAAPLLPHASHSLLVIPRHVRLSWEAAAALAFLLFDAPLALRFLTLPLTTLLLLALPLALLLFAHVTLLP
jgi:hypothetical protein